MIVPLAIALGLNYNVPKGNDFDGTDEYALTDKTIVTYNSVLCQGITAQSTNKPMSSQSNATLYVLNRVPTTSGVENFNVSEKATFNTMGDYHHWNFYLNEGSNVSLKVCQSNDYSSIEFCLIKGSDNFNEWSDHGIVYDNIDSCVNSKILVSGCSTISYKIPDSDKYYFTFYADGFVSVQINVDFYIQRKVYQVSPETIEQQCSFPLDGHSNCSVAVPVSSSYTALLSLNTTLPVDYDAGATFDIDCQPRVWFYVVICVGALVPAAVIVILVTVCLCVMIKRRKSNYSPLAGNNDITGKDAFEDSGNVTASPRGAVNHVTTYSPSAPPPPGTYGAIPETVAPPYAQ